MISITDSSRLVKQFYKSKFLFLPGKSFQILCECWDLLKCNITDCSYDFFIDVDVFFTLELLTNSATSGLKRCFQSLQTDDDEEKSIE